VSGEHAPGSTDTYTITLTNGETYSFTVYNGANGINGVDGVDGIDGADAPIPEFKIDESGHLICTLDGVDSDLGNVVGKDGINAEVEYKIPTFRLNDGNLYVFVQNK